MTCPHCGNIVSIRTCYVSDGIRKCGNCAKPLLDQDAVFSMNEGRCETAAHPNERSVVWRHPGTGETRFPGRNDAPMPERYRRAGFERQELPTLRSIERFEKERGVQSECAHFDRGSGRGFDV